MNEKYEFTGVEKVCDGVTLKQIRRLEDGAIGGWIEAEKNLSASGDAWVSDDARVSGAARVFGDAQVSGAARVFGAARVSGDAQVSGAARVSGAAQVSGAMDFVHVSGMRYAVTILNDGHASIGCQTKTISDWLNTVFADQSEFTDEQEFSYMRAVLEPAFRLFQTRFELKEEKNEHVELRPMETE